VTKLLSAVSQKSQKWREFNISIPPYGAKSCHFDQTSPLGTFCGSESRDLLKKLRSNNPFGLRTVIIFSIRFYLAPPIFLLNIIIFIFCCRNYSCSFSVYFRFQFMPSLSFVSTFLFLFSAHCITYKQLWRHKPEVPPIFPVIFAQIYTNFRIFLQSPWNSDVIGWRNAGNHETRNQGWL